MIKTFSVMILLLSLAACNSIENRVSTAAQKQNPRSGQVATTYADGIRRITIKEFEELIKKGEVFIVDVRNQASYDQGHIPGAKLIPSTEILNHIKDLPRDKTIVTYCS